MLVVTTDNIPGFEVSAVIGEVVGVTARTYNPYIEGVKTLNGKLNPQLVRLLVQIRHEAVANLVEAAQRRGANAVIGLRFDNRGVTSAWTEICAYGTAVLAVSATQRELPAEPVVAATATAAPGRDEPPAYQYRTSY